MSRPFSTNGGTAHVNALRLKIQKARRQGARHRFFEVAAYHVRPAAAAPDSFATAVMHMTMAFATRADPTFDEFAAAFRQRDATLPPCVFVHASEISPKRFYEINGRKDAVRIIRAAAPTTGNGRPHRGFLVSLPRR